VGWVEAVRRELDQETERILEIDRVHEAAVLDAAVADPPLVETFERLVERRLRDRQGDVVYTARIGRRPAGIADPVLVGEDRYQPAVARIRVQVALRGVVEVRLLEHERHAEHTLPEVDRRLAVGADDRDVVNALTLKLSHARYLSTSFDLYSLRC